MTVGKGQENLDLEYQYTFIYSISCQHLQTFRPQAATLHTKFRENRSTGSGEDFEGFSLYGHGDHLDPVISIMLIISSFQSTLKLIYKIWLK